MAAKKKAKKSTKKKAMSAADKKAFYTKQRKDTAKRAYTDQGQSGDDQMKAQKTFNKIEGKLGRKGMKASRDAYMLAGSDK